MYICPRCPVTATPGPQVATESHQEHGWHGEEARGEGALCHVVKSHCRGKEASRLLPILSGLDSNLLLCFCVSDIRKKGSGPFSLPQVDGRVLPQRQM